MSKKYLLNSIYFQLLFDSVIIGFILNSPGDGIRSLKDNTIEQHHQILYNV